MEEKDRWPYVSVSDSWADSCPFFCFDLDSEIPSKPIRDMITTNRKREAGDKTRSNLLSVQYYDIWRIACYRRKCVQKDFVLQ